MIIKPIKTSIFQEGDNLFEFIAKYFKTIPERAVIVVTSKIVALAEKRTVSFSDKISKEELIRQESDFAIHGKYAWITIKDGMVVSSAGIDESNSQGKFILLPKDSFKTASLLRKKLKQKYKVKDLGVLIVDSRSLPFRSGIIGSALGYAGFKGVRNYRNKADIFGRKFKFSRTNIGDGLATAAVLAMGEGSEQQPLAIIKKAPITFCDKVNRNELKVDINDDMHGELFLHLASKK